VIWFTCPTINLQMNSPNQIPVAREQVLQHFSVTRVLEHQSFRSLCNALKALGIATAVKALRENRKGRMTVLDLGCGKGGDVGKWMAHRPKNLLGLDGSAPCIEEARNRHTALVSNGRGSMEAVFAVSDLCNPLVTLPAASGSVDIASSHFFLQFAARDVDTMTAIVNESARVLAKGGIFWCLVPDGDRVLSLLQSETPRVRFGHFHFHKCHGVSYASDSPAFGAAYCFSFGEEGCTEYVLLPELLSSVLKTAGFVGLFEDECMSLPAQDFFLRSASLQRSGRNGAYATPNKKVQQRIS
jgi:ubiquinone/menaquinone biosynthesis C-methylase UbiE